MGVVWVVDQPKEILPEYLSALMGNFPCRVIGSVSSVSKLLKLQSHTRPNVVLVNMTVIGSCPHLIREVLSCDLPATPIVCLFEGGTFSHGALNWRLDASAAEIVTQVRRLLRATVAYQHSKIFMDTLVLDTENHTLEDKSQGYLEILTPKETRILRVLIDQKGQCVSRDVLKEKVWNGTVVSDRTIDSHISRLRKRLMVANLAIENIYGDGYVLR